MQNKIFNVMILTIGQKVQCEQKFSLKFVQHDKTHGRVFGYIAVTKM